MMEPAPKGIKPPKVGPDGNVLGSSLKPEAFQQAANAFSAVVAGFESTAVDPDTGAIRANTLTEDEWKSMSPLQQDAYLMGVQNKQDIALDALREKENGKKE